MVFTCNGDIFGTLIMFKMLHIAFIDWYLNVTHDMLNLNPSK
jgi:hypothetical protein